MEKWIEADIKIKKNDDGIELTRLIEKLAEREDITREEINSFLSGSFSKAYRRDENKDANLSFSFNGSFKAYRIYDIVDSPISKDTEISKEDLKKNNNKSAKITENKFIVPINLKNLPFSTVTDFRNNLESEISKIRGERGFEFFKTWERKIVSGRIRAIKENNTYYEVELLFSQQKGKGADRKAYGLWRTDEWGHERRKPRFDQMFWFLISEVKMTKDDGNNFKIYLTRKDEEFIVKSLEMYIPELYRKEISIKKIIRIPGLISKVVVNTDVVGLNVLGSCLGKGSFRIKEITKTCFPERIDIVPFSEDKKKLLLKLISPAKSVSVLFSQKKFSNKFSNISEENHDFREGEENITKKKTFSSSKEKDIKKIITLILPKDQMSLVLQYKGVLLKKISEYLEEGDIIVKNFDKLRGEKTSSFFVWNGNVSASDLNSVTDNEKKHNIW